MNRKSIVSTLAATTIGLIATAQLTFATGTAQAEEKYTGELLSTIDLGEPAEGFGGISGLTHLGGDEYMALSDDSTGKSRMYRMTIPADYNANDKIKVTDTIMLHDPQGNPYPKESVDPESIRLLPDGTLAWTTEGWAKDGNFIAPGIIISDQQGKELRRIAAPAYHAPTPDGKMGISHNQANEGLTRIYGNDDILMTINEGTLIQDGEQNTEEHGMKVRLTQYSLSKGEAIAEYVVEIGPRYPHSKLRGPSEIIAANDGSFYIIERGYIPDNGNLGEIYRITLDGATNVLGRSALDGTEVPVKKELVFDFASMLKNDGTDPIDNVEALSWGPVLPDGRAQLIVIADDNFNETQRTLLDRIAIAKN
ncbi:esterase-like activity of phytase family protein [Corynebacterium sp. sy017]|uniref:esterase-like activity of phytase family protein n=1 Tax=unclassified Corynebacterium TaxID=2624378 RepID=UPI00118713AC|nr:MULTISPECIES: esterase-like activity of phytase family protein [unclassified Corynebacterium]MBP3088231.1 esterase-like activity of phytase family protein [Corynebacterium sp. sy017]QDZ43418.1 esterase-like activity of phytase family protein [Corynebacterium sp. sy039]TSD91562.1 esterase-like activity of phytase family protein [Corynebacterium sp. SY003]